MIDNGIEKEENRKRMRGGEEEYYKMRQNGDKKRCRAGKR